MTTTKTLSYRLRQRNQRTVTTPCTYNAGMFYTDFVVPEKYAKVLVNYDINDSSGALTTRPGKINETVLLKDIYGNPTEASDLTSSEYGEPHLTDFLYTSKADNFDLSDAPEIEGLYDTVLSFGKPMKMNDVIPANVLSDKIKDRLCIAAAYNTTHIVGDKITYVHGNHCWGAIQTNKEGWGLFTEAYAYSYNTPTQLQEHVLGAITARSYHNAQLFDCPINNDIVKPVYTVLNGEIYAFTIPALDYVNNNGVESITPTVDNFRLSKIYIDQYNPDYETHKHYNIRCKKIEPQQINVLTAATTGFNLLLDDPFTFKNQVGSTDVQGVLLYESDTEGADVIASPNLGQSVFARAFVYYVAGVQYEILWQYSRDAKDWTDLSDGFEPIGEVGPDTVVGITFNVTDSFFYLRVIYREVGLEATERVMATPAFMTDDTLAKKLFRLDEFKNMDMSTAKGMFTWKQLIGLWGIKGFENSIFFSDTENPAYFPSYGYQYFDGEIIGVVPMNETLLVWTNDGCYAMTGGPLYENMQTVQVLTNIHVTPLDAETMVVLKDQLFFQMDHAFYVLKPNANTSDGTDLKNYLNSISIADLLNNFKPNIINILNDVYKSVITKEHAPMHNIGKHGIQDFEITGVYSQISNSVLYYTCKIHPIFKYEQVLKDMFIHLIYDPITRTWRIHTEGIMDGGITYASPLKHKDKNTNLIYTFDPFKFIRHNTVVAGIAVNKYDKDHISDNVTLDMKDEYGNYITTDIKADNYQLLDTGHPAIDDRPVKRFRELQIVIQNKHLDTIRFFSEFLIDGHKTVDTTHYDVKHITDPTDPAYGQIYVAPYMIENLELFGDTHLKNRLEPDDGWQLDLSQFPNLESVTIRFELFGKGKHARYKLTCADLKRYEISSIVWVTRTMNAR